MRRATRSAPVWAALQGHGRRIWNGQKFLRTPPKQRGVGNTNSQCCNLLCFLYIYIYGVCMGMIPPSPPALSACPAPPHAGQPEARPTCMSYIHPTHIPSTSCIGRPGPSTALAHVFLQHNCPSETRCHVIFPPSPLLTLSHIEATPGRWGTPAFPISSHIKTVQPSPGAVLFNEEFVSRTDQILCV